MLSFTLAPLGLDMSTITRHLPAVFFGTTATLLVMTCAHSLWENGPAIYPFSSWARIYWSTTTLCSCAEGVLWELALHAGASCIPMRNPCRIPVRSAATHSGLGCPARALPHASAFRGEAMGLAMSPGGMPIHGTVWNGGAWSLQNCLASTGAMTVDVDIGMLPAAGPIEARGGDYCLFLFSAGLST